MRILLVHNNHRHGGGSEVVFQKTAVLLREAGHEVCTFTRDSKKLEEKTWLGNITAFLSGLYNPMALRDFARILEEFQPDLVHAHEVYPLITPWIYPLCKKRGIPTVMTCHDYRLTCPVYTHFRNGNVCTLCLEKGPMACMAHNCAGNIPVSTAYALRAMVGHWFHLFTYVDLFLTPSVFTKDWFIQHAAINPGRIHVVGNPVHTPPSPSTYVPCERTYIAYAGRLDPEKGVDLLIQAAAHTQVPLRIACDLKDTGAINTRGANVVFTGFLNEPQLAQFYSGARLLVAPSICFETFGLSIAEAMTHGLPVICSRIGALQEMVEENVNGVLFELGSWRDLAEKITLLWNHPDLCKKMSDASVNKSRRFHADQYLQKLDNAYRLVLPENNKH